MEKEIFSNTKKIVITGPESSGKTTLFTDLKSLNGYNFISEYSRKYIQHINRPYNYNDILEIAKYHVSNQISVSRKGLPIIFDTDLLTLLIWCEYKYKKCHPFILDQLINHPDLYLTCNPNIPGNLRSKRNPNDRKELFNIHLRKIRELGVEFNIEGYNSIRISQAKKILQKI